MHIRECQTCFHLVEVIKHLKLAFDSTSDGLLADFLESTEEEIVRALINILSGYEEKEQ